MIYREYDRIETIYPADTSIHDSLNHVLIPIHFDYDIKRDPLYTFSTQHFDGILTMLVLTSNDCHKVVCHLTRTHYTGAMTVPTAITHMMTSFLNLWRKHHLTADQCDEILMNIENGGHVEFPLETFKFRDLKFVVHMTGDILSHEEAVEDEEDGGDDDCVFFNLRLTPLDQNAVKHISGKFEIQEKYPEKDESTNIDYRRFAISDLSNEVRCRLSQNEPQIGFSNKAELQELSFSFYIDILQIQFSTDDRQDFDVMPRMSKYGAKQFSIEANNVANWLIKGCDGIWMPREEGEWRFVLRKNKYLRDQSANSELFLDIDPPYLPVKIWQIDLKIITMVTLGTGEEKSIVTREITNRFEAMNWLDFNPLIQTGIFNTDLRGAATLFLEIFWEIVALYDETGDVISEVDWETVGIVGGSTERVLLSPAEGKKQDSPQPDIQLLPGSLSGISARFGLLWHSPP